LALVAIGGKITYRPSEEPLFLDLGEFDVQYISIHNEPCEEGFGPLKIRLQETPSLPYEFIDIECGRVEPLHKDAEEGGGDAGG